MAERARYMSTLTREERYKKTLECYANIFGTDEAYNVRSY